MAVLGLIDAPGQAQRWVALLTDLSARIPSVLQPLGGDAGRWVMVLAGLALWLISYDVPQKLYRKVRHTIQGFPAGIGFIGLLAPISQTFRQMLSRHQQQHRTSEAKRPIVITMPSVLNEDVQTFIVRDEQLSPRAFSKLYKTDPGSIKTATVVAPKIGGNSFGAVHVEYFVPRIRNIFRLKRNKKR